MSVTVMARVFWTDIPALAYEEKKKRIGVDNKSAKLALLAIADNADDYGENSWQSFDTLAKKTGLKRRSVFRVIRALIKNDFCKLNGVSRYGTNDYAINLSKLGQIPLRRTKNGRPKTSDSEAETGDSEAETGDSEAETGDSQSPESSLPIHKPPMPVLENSEPEQTAEKANAPLFRGDFHDYPEHLWGIAETLRDVWKFNLPSKPQKKSSRADKSQYGFYCQAMDAIKDACGEFGADVMVKVHADWKSKFRDGIAPYTVAQPSSLIHVCAGKARELREGGGSKTSQSAPISKYDEKGNILSW